MFKVTFTTKSGETRTETYAEMMSAYNAMARHQEFGDWGGYNPNVKLEKVGA